MYIILLLKVIMATYYNATQCINIKEKYTEFDIAEWLIKMPTGRQMKAGSLRVNGFLKVLKTLKDGSIVPIVGDEGIFLNQYAGVHSLFRNTTCQINGRTIESLQQYSRYVAMATQHDATPEGIVTNSGHASELKGVLNNRLLVGDNAEKGCPFSMKPHVAINKSSSDLPQSKYNEIRLMFQLGAGIESFYIAGGRPTTPTINNISFELSDLQLSWMETNEVKGLASQPTTFNCMNQMTQTITGLNNSITIKSAVAYNAVSMSFLRQSSLNDLYLDSLMCEFVPDISRVEANVDGQSSPLTFAIRDRVYQDVALNYYESLSSSGSALWRVADPVKNSIKNRFLSENGAFGVGFAYATSINDSIQITITIDDNTAFNPSANQIDTYIYVNGFVTL